MNFYHTCKCGSQNYLFFNLIFLKHSYMCADCKRAYHWESIRKRVILRWSAILLAAILIILSLFVSEGFGFLLAFFEYILFVFHMATGNIVAVGESEVN